MSIALRSPLVAAMATAGVVALAPALIEPPAIPAASQVGLPAVHVSGVQLAGIGRDIYDEITAFVQYTVESAQFWIDLVPVVGPPLADQLGINYFQLIQPVVASTVYYLSDLIENPASFIQLTANYGANLYYAGYNWVSAQAEFIGLSPLPPIPEPTPLAAVGQPSARSAAVPVAGAATRETVSVSTAAPPAQAAAPQEVGRVVRDSARAARQTVRPGAAVIGDVRETAAPADPRGQTRKAAATRRAPAAADSVDGKAAGAEAASSN